MSEGEERSADEGTVRPAPLWLPSPDETQEALDKIAPARLPGPAKALKQLALAVIEAVTEVDQANQVSQYLTSLTVHCKGPNSFELEIFDRNCEVDPQSVAGSVKAELDERGSFGYHKPLRRIDINFETEESSDAAAEGPSTDPVP
jgi:hypothetical protein